MDVRCCLEALEHALSGGRPEIFTTDQGAQCTSQAFTARLQRGGVQISMDGRGRALDHVVVERLWRTVKDEEGSRRDDQSVWDARHHWARYCAFYNEERLHQALGYRTPAAVYRVRKNPSTRYGKKISWRPSNLTYVAPKMVWTMGYTSGSGSGRAARRRCRDPVIGWSMAGRTRVPAGAGAV
jgi:hypothetical protein